VLSIGFILFYYVSLYCLISDSRLFGFSVFITTIFINVLQCQLWKENRAVRLYLELIEERSALHFSILLFEGRSSLGDINVLAALDAMKFGKYVFTENRYYRICRYILVWLLHGVISKKSVILTFTFTNLKT